MLLEYLKSELAQRTKRNPTYSLRAFARSLDVQNSTLSAILNGKRPLTSKMAQKLLKNLDLSPSVKAQFLLSTTEASNTYEDEYEVLSKDTIDTIQGWEHFAILAALDIGNRARSLQEVSGMLDVGPQVVNQALNRLVKLGLVTYKDKKYKNSGKKLATTTDIPNTALRESHRQYIEKALYSLENHSLNERDITGITIAVNKKNLPKAKELIKNFRRSLSELLEAGEKESVYRLNVQLFPIRK